MILTLARWPALSDPPDRTLGELLVDGRHECYTLEDRLRPDSAPKIPGETAIPAGLYRVLVTWSPRFGRQMPLLADVPGFSGIRIHSGNEPEDTEGCVLVGVAIEDGRLLRSRDAYAALLSKIRGAVNDEGCFIDVRDPRPVPALTPTPTPTPSAKA